jgi:UDP-GlcNAc:undecaprenyl-phosphate GlcNAc-1-phosphate transferase
VIDAAVQCVAQTLASLAMAADAGVASTLGLPLLDVAPTHPPEAPTRLSIFEGYIGVLIVSFLVTLLATPVMRKLAILGDVIDRPNEARKIHKQPIAYLGGVGVYLGMMAGIAFALIGINFAGLVEWHKTEYLGPDGFVLPVPFSIMLGMTVIVLVGVIDDVAHISPRVKLGGQLFAAAALAIDEVGVQMAAGLILPIAKSLGIPLIEISPGVETLGFLIPLPVALPGMGTDIPIDLIYWIGTAIIGIAVIGLTNATNLIDGLDGLLSGTTAIASVGLLVVSLGLALADDGPRDGQRIILCLALLGGCMGFLPHNFNPATIFLGDAGSLLLGFVACVIILTLGDTGKTHLVAAGLIIYALPIIDTALAIVRRKMEGKPISAPDDQHLHHMLKRWLGVKGAVLVLYVIAASFATIGAGVSLVRARLIYFLAMVVASYIGIQAIKIARRKVFDAQAAALEQKPDAKADAKPVAATVASTPAAASPTPHALVVASPDAATQPVTSPVAQS